MEYFHSVSLSSLVIVPSSDDREPTKDVNTDAGSAPDSRRGGTLNEKGESKPHGQHDTKSPFFNNT